MLTFRRMAGRRYFLPLATLGIGFLVGVGLLACEREDGEILPSEGRDLVDRARRFRTLLRAGDYDAARRMAVPEPRRWWEERSGPGQTWSIAPASGPWASWDEEFRSRGEVVRWRSEPSAATAVVRETNDYFRLLERGSVINEITYFFDSEGQIEGLLIGATGERPTGRTEEFLAWARENAPGEIAGLMRGGEIDPSGDHPRRFRALLERWRAEAESGGS